MKKTGWIAGAMKPIHVGVYETKNSYGEILFQYWTGKHWGWLSKTIQCAAGQKKTKSYVQHRSWRGLTTKGGK